MGKPTLKKMICAHLAETTLLKELSDYKVNLITPLGIISCSLPSDDDFKNSTTSKFLNDFTSEVSKNYREENDISSEYLDNNDGYMLVKDATIITPHNKVIVGEMVLFYDQIIGITIGTLK